MTKFNELSIIDLHNMGDQINNIFLMYGIGEDSIATFWECVDIGNKKYEGA